MSRSATSDDNSDDEDHSDDDDQIERPWGRNSDKIKPTMARHPIVINDDCEPNILTRQQFISPEDMEFIQQVLLPPCNVRGAPPPQQWRSFAHDGSDIWEKLFKSNPPDTTDPEDLFAIVFFLRKCFCFVKTPKLSVHAMFYEQETDTTKRTKCDKLTKTQMMDMLNQHKVLTRDANENPKQTKLGAWFYDCKFKLERVTASAGESDSETNLYTPLVIAKPPSYKLRFDGKDKPGSLPDDDPGLQFDGTYFDKDALFTAIHKQALASEEKGDPANENMKSLLRVFCLWYLASNRDREKFVMHLKWHAWELQNLDKKFPLMRIFQSDPGGCKDMLFQHFIGKGVWGEKLYCPIPSLTKLTDPKDNFHQLGFKLKTIPEFGVDQGLTPKVREFIKARITDPATVHAGMGKETVYAGVDDKASYIMFVNDLLALRQLPLNNNRRFAITAMCNKYTTNGAYVCVCHCFFGDTYE
jgi:hypothetical protein